MPLLAIGAEKSFSAMNKSELAFVYAYAPDCSYCEKFKPNYEKLVQKYGKIFAFSKVDVTTKEGAVYAKDLGVYWVPNITLLNYNKQIMNKVPPECMRDYACVVEVVEEFIK